MQLIHWFLSLYIKYHFGRKEVYSFRCQVNPYNCSREISRYETQYGVTEIISGDKMLCKHNPKMKSYERKHLLMRINFISFHPQWKFMWTEIFSWWNKILFQDSSKHPINVNLKKALRSTCAVKFILIFSSSLLQTRWPKRLGCFISILLFNSSCKTYMSKSRQTIVAGTDPLSNLAIHKFR